MPNTLSRQEVKRFALIGAQARLNELQAEIASLLKAFPELAKQAPAKRGRPRAAAAVAETASPAVKRGRKRQRNPMSDDQKQAVSDRMKKYWAARRKEKGKKA